MTTKQNQPIDALMEQPSETAESGAMRPLTLFLILLLVLVVAPGSLIYSHQDFLARDQVVVGRQPLGNGFVVEQRESGRAFVCDDQRRACILAQQPGKEP
jgi:hypothetical protein